MARYGTPAYWNRIEALAAKQALADAKMLVRQQATDLIWASKSAAGTAIGNRLIQMSGVWNGIANGEDANHRKDLHRQIGAKAQQAVQTAYQTSVVAQKKVASYRRGRNRMPGGLLKAINKANFFNATAEGLQIINIAELDKQAKHWGRLNFGAGAAGLGAHEAYPMGGGWKGSLGMTDSARDPFGIPPGIWLTANGKRADGGAVAGFYPTRKGPMKMTKGIQARQFLDRALFAMARDFPEAYENYYRDVFNQARRKKPVGPLAIYVSPGSGRGLAGIPRPRRLF